MKISICYMLLLCCLCQSVRSFVIHKSQTYSPLSTCNSMANYAGLSTIKNVKVYIPGNNPTLQKSPIPISIKRVLTAKEINFKINKFFSKDFLIQDIKNIKSFLHNVRHQLDHIHVLTVLHRCSKYNIDFEDIIEWDIILEAFSKSAVVFNSQSLANSLFVLHHMCKKKNELRLTAYLEIIQDKIRSTNIKYLNAQGVGMSLYGLQKFDHQPTILKLLTLLTPMIDIPHSLKDIHFLNQLSGQEISNAIYGLQNMNSESKEVKNLLYALTNRIQKIPHRILFTPQNIGMTLYGLKSMSSDVAEVRLLLKILLPHFAGISLDAQAISNALYGLQGMRNDNNEVDDLLNFLASSIENSPVQLSMLEISMSLYGLQNLHNSNSETFRRLLEAVKTKVKTVNINLNTNEISFRVLSNALYGMRFMSDINTNGYGNDVVSNLMTTISEVLFTRRNLKAEDISGQCLAMSLHGLRYMNATSDTMLNIITSITSLMDNYIKRKPITLSGQELAMCVQGISTWDLSESNIILCKFMKLLLHVMKVENGRREVKSELLITRNEFCSILYGLRFFNTEYDIVRSLLTVFLQRENTTLDSTVPVTAWSISSGLYGLQHFSGDLLETERTLTVLHRYLMDLEESEVLAFTGQGIAMSLFGLQNQHSDSAVVRGILQCLLRPMMREELTMDIQGVAMSLYGLKKMTSDTIEVKNILLQLGRQLMLLNKEGQKMNGQAFSMCLSGLQNMNGLDTEVRLVLSCILKVLPVISDEVNSEESLKISTSHFDTASLATALYSLRDMPKESKEIKYFLRFLAPAVITRCFEFNHKESTMALLGLRNMDAEMHEVKVMIQGILSVLESSGRSSNAYFKSYVNRAAAQAWMPFLVGFFLLHEQIGFIFSFDSIGIT